MKPRLSVIITSFNRPNFLLRSIKFLVSYKLPIQLIILDSSKKKFESTEFNNLVNQLKYLQDYMRLLAQEESIENENAKNVEYPVMYADKLKTPNSTAIYAFLMTKKCHFLQPKNPDTDRWRRKKDSKKKN